MSMFPIPELNLTSSDRALLDRRDCTIGGGLSRGQYGVVYRATHYDEPCAAKVINLVALTPLVRTKFLPREVYIMQTLRHPFMAEVLDIFSVSHHSKLIIFMELLDGGHLAKLIRDTACWLTEQRTASFYLQFGDAIRYMHR